MSLRLRLLVLLLVHAAAAQDLRIGVVESAPGRALQLAAALEAALGEGAALVAPVEPDEPLAAQAHVCAQAAEEAAAAVSDGGERAAALGADAAARAGLPLLLLGPVAAADAAWEALALYPPDDIIAQAVVDLCEAKGWRSAALLHEGSARGIALLAPDVESLKLLPRRLPPPDDESLLRNLLLLLKKSGVTEFIVWCGAACGARVLDAAQRVGLLSARHSYVLATLDLHTMPLAHFRSVTSTITALRAPLLRAGHAGPAHHALTTSRCSGTVLYAL
ncbi:hypothetical protein evm_013501 [Chilo suppressalis]|nr:hypothetical protein evm_013501 [Chilo suppressalis]